MNNIFADNLKKIRKENNLSQEQLAEELGVSRQAISKWESALAYPEMDKIIALCDKFNLNIDDLLHKDIKEVKGEEESKKNLNKNIDDVLNFITDTINLFSNMTFKSKIKCLVEQIIIAVILIAISCIIYFFTNYILLGFFNIFPYKIGYIFNSIFEYIIIIFLFIASIIILVHIFKTRYLDYYSKLKCDFSNEKEILKKEDNKTEIKNNKVLFKNNDNKIIIRDPRHSEYHFINGLFKFIVGIIKMFALFLTLFLCLILVILFGGLVFSFTIWKTGIFFIGLLLAILSSSIINIIFILIILNFIFNRKSDKKKLIWSFIISLISLGVGVGLIIIGILNFDVIEKPSELLKTESLEYQMQDNLFFDFYKDIEYIESDIDNVKIEYKVLKSCSVEDHINTKNGIYLYSFCANPMKLIREIIQNFNNKKLIDFDDNLVDIKIYASKENIDKLKTNNENYYLEQEEYNDEINYYKDLLTKYENQINNYEDKIFELETRINNYEQRIQYN